MSHFPFGDSDAVRHSMTAARQASCAGQAHVGRIADLGGGVQQVMQGGYPSGATLGVVRSDGEAAQRPVTPTQILDQHLAGLRWSAQCAQCDVDHMQAMLNRALATRDETAKAVADFEAELAKR